MDVTLTLEHAEEYWEEYPASLLLKHNKQQINVSIDHALILIFIHNNLALSSPQFNPELRIILRTHSSVEVFYLHVFPVSVFSVDSTWKKTSVTTFKQTSQI